MSASRIALFAILLFVLHVAAGALVTVVVGVDQIGRFMFVEYIVGAVVSICVFACMTWANPAKPYLSALLVGILATLIGIISSALLLGDALWWASPILILDFFVLLVSVMLGASIGVMLNRRKKY